MDYTSIWSLAGVDLFYQNSVVITQRVWHTFKMMHYDVPVIPSSIDLYNVSHSVEQDSLVDNRLIGV